MTNGSSKDRARMQEVLELVEREQVKFINLQFTDIVGMVKHVTLPAHELGDALEHGKRFDGSSIEALPASTRAICTGAHPIPLGSYHSARGLTTAKVICNICTPDGEPHWRSEVCS